jgi:hypothetical protein
MFVLKLIVNLFVELCVAEDDVGCVIESSRTSYFTFRVLVAIPVRVGKGPMVEESDASSGGFTIHSGEATEYNVIVHNESILAGTQFQEESK